MLDEKRIKFEKPLKKKTEGFIALLKRKDGRLILPIRGGEVKSGKANYNREGFILFITKEGARKWIGALPNDYQKMAVIVPVIGNRIIAQGREYVDVLTDVPAMLVQIVIIGGRNA